MGNRRQLLVKSDRSSFTLAIIKSIFYYQFQLKNKRTELPIFLFFSVKFLNKNSTLKEKKKKSVLLRGQSQDMTNYGTILNFIPVPKQHIFNDRLVIITKNFPCLQVMKKHITDKHINLSTQYNVKP